MQSEKEPVLVNGDASHHNSDAEEHNDITVTKPAKNGDNKSAEDKSQVTVKEETPEAMDTTEKVNNDVKEEEKEEEIKIIKSEESKSEDQEVKPTDLTTDTKDQKVR